MAVIDTNLIVGTCPFRAVPSGVEDMLALREKAELDLGIATGFDSIFYYDPIAGLARDLERFEPLNDWLRFYAVINPEFPQLEQQIEHAAANPRIAGLRLFPTLHHYPLASERIRLVLDLAGRANLPVNLTARLLDTRVAPRYLHQETLDRSEVETFLNAAKRTNIILSMFFFGELKLMNEALGKNGNVFIDPGCSKPSTAAFDELPDWFSPGRVVLGTGAPLYYWGGSRLAVQGSRLTQEQQEAVLGNNALELFAWT